MYSLVLSLFLFICILMTVAILLQSSKGGGLAGTFGGGGGNMGSVFGARGAATFLSKVTTFLAVAYLLFSFLLSKMEASTSQPKSLVEQRRGEMNTGPASLLPTLESPPATAVQPGQQPAGSDSVK